MDKTIVEKILAKLEEVEKTENIRILHCVESGSRAWGFASPDSDYDVRFIYVRPKDFYLKLEKTRDVIELELNEIYDINGWDIQKTLTLLHKSNPTIFEWNNSPIIYKTTKDWKIISEKINSFFVSKSGLYHYISTAKSNYREYLRGEIVRLKKYFYVLRPILACKWILKNGTPPPMLFDDLAASCLEPEMTETVNNLLKIKRETPELGNGPRIGKLNDYLDENIETISNLVKELPEDKSSKWEELDEMFLSVLK